MNSFPESLEDLIVRLSKLPGVGRRSAERIAFYILKMGAPEGKILAQRILEVHKDIKPCSLCNNFSTKEVCTICSNPRRDPEVVCVVEEPKDILAIEKTSQYKGRYYVLLGAISPLEGVGPQDLSIRKLMNRVERGEIKEVIISTDADNEGELTAQFLIEKLSPYKVKIYRIGIGIPLGTQIEYIDSGTLGRAFLERKPLV
jgi:recombination protein RecR